MESLTHFNVPYINFHLVTQQRKIMCHMDKGWWSQVLRHLSSSHTPSLVRHRRQHWDQIHGRIGVYDSLYTVFEYLDTTHQSNRASRKVIRRSRRPNFGRLVAASCHTWTWSLLHFFFLSLLLLFIF